MIMKNRSTSLNRFISSVVWRLVFVTMAAGISSSITYAEINQSSGCPDGVSSSHAAGVDNLKEAENLLNRAQVSFRRGEYMCGERTVQRVNRHAASSKDPDVQARLFFLVKDAVLSSIANEDGSADQKARRVALGLQHEAVSQPTADDYFADIAFLVKSAEVIGSKAESCEGAKLYLKAARLEERLPTGHNRYIEWQGLQKEIERDAQTWCFGEITEIAKVIANTHPDIKINPLMSRIIYYRFSQGYVEASKTESNLVQRRLVAVGSLIKYFDSATPFISDCLFCGKDARPVLIGLLMQISGFLEIARGTTDLASHNFDEAFKRYGSVPEAAFRSWHRLVLASKMLNIGVDVEHVARLTVVAREDVNAIDNVEHRKDRARMYNSVSERLRSELMKKGKPVPKELIPIPSA
jgi:hypothetical protein